MKELYFKAETAHFGAEVYRLGKRDPCFRARTYMVKKSNGKRYEIAYTRFDTLDEAEALKQFMSGVAWCAGRLQEYEDELEHMQNAAQQASISEDLIKLYEQIDPEYGAKLRALMKGDIKARIYPDGESGKTPM